MAADDRRQVRHRGPAPARPDHGQKVRGLDEHLYHGATLGNLPADGEGPHFVINATNVQTGKLYRFSRPYQGDYAVGLWREPATRLADAVAASSAFPPFLSPHTLAPSGRFDDRTAGEHDDPSFTGELWLSDGGVYDNLGLETAWKRYRMLLVSDGGDASNRWSPPSGTGLSMGSGWPRSSTVRSGASGSDN